MFKRIAIQGSPETTRRVGTACERLGIEVVGGAGAAHDADHEHVDVEALVEEAKRQGAEAIHPGDSLPGEQALLAQATRQATLVYVGPPSDALQVLRDKLAIRALAVEHGVPVVPATEGPVDPGSARDAAEALGYPVLVKPVAGTFGLGIHGASDEDDLDEAVARAIADAESLFGDSRVYLERRIERPRQLEVTVVAPAPGDTLAFVERECSLQADCRVLLAESPAPALVHQSVALALRESLQETAETLASALGVTGLVNFEFLLAPDGSAYLLDANAGVPPAYAVTELACAVDLLELDLQIAAGLPLPKLREPRLRTGHAVQARLFALGDAPISITEVRWPPLVHGRARIDSALRAGSEVCVTDGPDPIATITAFAPIRHQALLGLDRLLAESYVAPVPTNLDALRRVLNDRSFMAGQYDAEFLGRLEREGAPSA